MSDKCRRVKLHIPKPPKPEFNIVFERRGTPIECTLRLDEPPLFCTLIKNSNLLLQVPCCDVISPLRINENTIKLTNYVTITFPNSRYTLLFKSLIETNSENSVIEENNAFADDEECSDSTYEAFSPISKNILSISPSFANRGKEIVGAFMCDNVPIFISGSFESNSSLCFSEIRDRDDQNFVIVKIEWKLSRNWGDRENFEELVSTGTSLKLNDFMIGRFIQLSICWSEKRHCDEPSKGIIYKQSVVKGPVLPNQNLARDIMIHSLTDSIVFNTMICKDNSDDECNYVPATLIFNQNNIFIREDSEDSMSIIFSIDRVRITMDKYILTLFEESEKTVNLSMSDDDSIVLLFNVIIFRKYREKYATLAKWQKDLNIGLYSDFNRIYSKILKTERYIM